MRRRLILRSGFFLTLAKLAVILLALGLTIKAYQWLFILVHIDCLVETQTCPSEIDQEFNSLKGNSLLQLNAEELEKQLIERHLEYASMSVRPYLPGSAQIQLIRAHEIAQVAVSTMSANWMIVTDNQVVTQSLAASSSALPQIVDMQLPTVSVGEQIPDSQLKKALNLLVALQKNYLPPTQLSIEGGSIKVDDTDGISVWYNLDKDFLLQISAVQVILQKNLDRPIESIDVRYDKPVIRFVPNL